MQTSQGSRGNDNIVNFMQFCEARHKPGAGLYDEEE